MNMSIMDYIMTTSELTKIYGSKVAVENINIHIREGEIYGLIGRNGAGKTTIMRMLSGLSNPTKGTFSMFGKEGAEAKKYMHQVGVLIEHPGLYPNKSAFENLKIKALGLGVYSKSYIDDIITLVGLENTGKKQAGSFSLGMRQRLGIGLAIVGEPKLIILDEPINGLDPQGIVEVRKMLENLRDEKKITVMISSHILEELGKISNSYGIIHEGELLDEFTTDELSKRCGQFVLIKGPDSKAAIDVLAKNGYKNTELDNEGFVRVNEKLDESDKMIKALVNGNVAVKEVSVTNTSLEDYYLSVTGGGHNG